MSLTAYSLLTPQLHSDSTLVQGRIIGYPSQMLFCLYLHLFSYKYCVLEDFKTYSIHISVCAFLFGISLDHRQISLRRRYYTFLTLFFIIFLLNLQGETINKTKLPINDFYGELRTPQTSEGMRKPVTLAHMQSHTHSHTHTHTN